MKLPQSRLLLPKFAALLALSELIIGGARAQPIATPIVVSEIPITQIPVRNVNPSLLAYWLDPNHQPMPQSLKSSARNGGYWTYSLDKMTRQPGNANGPRDLKLPDGVEIVAAVEPQNLLLVRGTTASVEQLRKLAKEIDVPLSQVEIQAQLWEVAPPELAALPLKFYDSTVSDEKPAPLFAQAAFALTTDETSRALQNLAEHQRARLITAPRVTAFDGLAARLMMTETRPIAVDGTPQNELIKQLKVNSVRQPLPDN